QGDMLVWWPKRSRPGWMGRAEYEGLPNRLCLRAVRVGVRKRGFRADELVAVTTLLDPRLAGAEEIAGLTAPGGGAETVPDGSSSVAPAGPPFRDGNPQNRRTHPLNSGDDFSVADGGRRGYPAPGPFAPKHIPEKG